MCINGDGNYSRPLFFNQRDYSLHNQNNKDMEILKTEIKQLLAVSADDIKGEIEVVNGAISKCNITIFDKTKGDLVLVLTETQIRQLSQELTGISQHLDSVNKVGKDG